MIFVCLATGQISKVILLTPSNIDDNECKSGVSKALFVGLN